MEWHDNSCRRLDLVSFDGIESCRRCGSFAGLTKPPLLPPIKHRSEIRLLRLLPGTFDEDIQCEVIIQDLSAKPEYEAISYSWADETGNSDKLEIILISGKPFRVTRNCQTALKRIRRLYSYRNVWIDAVCIDQDNIKERGHQVQLMPHIYSGAHKVLIYVGEAANRSDWCLDTLSTLSQKGYDPVTFEPPLKHFLAREYFHRIWVLQEVALARRATLICGDKSIPWHAFVNNQSDLSTMSKTWDYSTLPAVIYFNFHTYTRPRRFLYLLDLARNCRAEDPRDKVFALLGLAVDVSLDGIVPDYGLDVVDVYTKVALYLGPTYGWSNLLYRSGSTALLLLIIATGTTCSAVAHLPA
ncbi:heterokaryon incompatibility protein-domain-containing protein [Biscogniauxia marginata]|nr:heterokaryon incompatibility protein-domain-containing protein [Biscogniauxia marginata]